MPDSLRFEYIRLDARVTTTPQGFLQIPGSISRVGVLKYRRADGGFLRELRPPEEVFRKDSIESLKRAPLTDMHSSMVTPDNVGSLQVGFVGEDVRKDGDFLDGTLTVQRRDMIQKIQTRKRTELSPGYKVAVDPTPGEFNGERYDQIQRNIVYNHVAIGPEGWGRSGSEVALRLDGADEVAVSRPCVSFNDLLCDQLVRHNASPELIARLDDKDFEAMPKEERIRQMAKALKIPFADMFDSLLEDRSDSIPVINTTDVETAAKDKKRKGVSKMKVKVRLDGITYEIEVPEALEASFTDAIAKQSRERKDAKDEISTLTGKLDATTKERDELKGKLEKAEAPERLDSLVNERVDFIERARKLDPEIKTDAKKPREIKIAALEKAGYDPKRFDGKDDAYVDGVFETASERAEAPEPKTRSIGAPPSPKPAEKRTDGRDDRPVNREDASDQTTADARERMHERNRDMYLKPLSMTK